VMSATKLYEAVKNPGLYLDRYFRSVVALFRPR
jgi:hypothetical protein